MWTLLQEYKNYSGFPTVHVERIAKVWGKILGEEILDSPDQKTQNFLKEFLKRVIDSLKSGLKVDCWGYFLRH